MRGPEKRPDQERRWERSDKYIAAFKLTVIHSTNTYQVPILYQALFQAVTGINQVLAKGAYSFIDQNK